MLILNIEHNLFDTMWMKKYPEYKVIKILNMCTAQKTKPWSELGDTTVPNMKTNSTSMYLS